MNEAAIDDLKQFIAGLFAQHDASIRAELHAGLHQLDQKIDKVDKKIDDLSASVAEALESNNEDIDTRLNNHERRITKLEAKQA